MVATSPDTTIVDGGLTISAFSSAPLAQHTYVVEDASGSAVIVDPGGRAQDVIGYVNRRRLRVVAVLATHAHHDHVASAGEIAAAVAAPFIVHSRDTTVLRAAASYQLLFRRGEPAIPPPDMFLDQIDAPIEIGARIVRIIETPGHSPGGVSYLIGSHLFTGDTVMKDVVGRTDLPGGDPSELARSIDVLMALPDHTTVWPGHGVRTTVGDERKANGQLRGKLAL